MTLAAWTLEAIPEDTPNTLEEPGLRQEDNLETLQVPEANTRCTDPGVNTVGYPVGLLTEKGLTILLFRQGLAN